MIRDCNPNGLGNEFAQGNDQTHPLLSQITALGIIAILIIVRLPSPKIPTFAQSKITMPNDDQFCIVGVEAIDDDCRANRCTLLTEILLTNPWVIVIDCIPFLLVNDTKFQS